MWRRANILRKEITDENQKHHQDTRNPQVSQELLNRAGVNDGVNEKSYIASTVAPMFTPPITVWNKGGSLTGAPRYACADAGRFRFPDGQEVLVAIFMDDISDNPGDFDTASTDTINAAVQTIRDVARLIANQFHR